MLSSKQSPATGEDDELLELLIFKRAASEFVVFSPRIVYDHVFQFQLIGKIY